jgi:hypothetical protein
MKDIKRRFTNFPHPLWAFCLLLLGLFLLASAARPATAASPLAVAILPEQIELAAGGSAQAIVLAQNQGETPLAKVTAAPFTNLPLAAAIVPTAPRTLASGETAVYTLTLTATETIPTGPLFVRVAYRQAAVEADALAITGVAHGMATVAGRPPPSAEERMAASVETALEQLNEQQPGTVYLLLHNTGDTAVSLQQIIPSGPAFLSFTVAGRNRPFTLEPGENTAVPIQIQAGDVVRPGAHLLLFEVDLAWRQGGVAYADNLIVTHPIQIGILGESELLTILAVPSFLFLPGFLMVLTVGLLWKLSAREEEFPLKSNTPEAWLVAITLSILVAFVYPWATEQLSGVRRDYLQGYGLTDILFVWFSAIVAAAVAYVAAVGGHNLFGRARRYLTAAHTARHTPGRGDDPLTILEKLARQGLGVYRERATIRMDGVAQTAFLLQPRPAAAEIVWLGPAIIVAWEDNADLTLRREVEGQLNEGGNAETLAALLAQGRCNGNLSVSWRKSKYLNGPEPISSDKIQTFISPDVIVEQE